MPATRESGALDSKAATLMLGAEGVQQPHTFRFCPLGIQFYSPKPLDEFQVLNFKLKVTQPGNGASEINCNGVVVECRGDRHTGYLVSLVLTGLSRQSQERLNMLAYSSPA